MLCSVISYHCNTLHDVTALTQCIEDLGLASTIKFVYAALGVGLAGIVYIICGVAVVYQILFGWTRERSCDCRYRRMSLAGNI